SAPPLAAQNAPLNQRNPLAVRATAVVPAEIRILDGTNLAGTCSALPAVPGCDASPLLRARSPLSAGPRRPPRPRPPPAPSTISLAWSRAYRQSHPKTACRLPPARIFQRVGRPRP